MEIPDEQKESLKTIVTGYPSSAISIPESIEFDDVFIDLEGTHNYCKENLKIFKLEPKLVEEDSSNG